MGVRERKTDRQETETDRERHRERHRESVYVSRTTKWLERDGDEGGGLRGRGGGAKPLEPIHPLKSGPSSH